MPDEVKSTLSAASDAAAAAVSEPAPAPAPEPEPELEPLPEGVDTFDRPYVEELRAENAKQRTRGRDIEAAFASYSPVQKERFLQLAANLTADPEAALVEFEDVTNNLRKQLGKEVPTVSDEAVAAAEAAAATTEEVAPAALTVDDVNRLVAERLDAERASAAQQSDVDATFAQAAAIDESYAAGSPALVHLLAVAQNDPAAEGTLEGAHKVIQGQLADFAANAVQEYRDGIRTGAAHPPRLPQGDPQSQKATGPPKTIEEASARATERMNAAFQQGE